MNRPLSRDEFERLCKQFPPSAKTTTVRVFGSKTIYSRNELEYANDDGTHKVLFHEAQSCECCGRLYGVGGSDAAGPCATCGKLTCTVPGCAANCASCGKPVCAADSTTIRDKVFCKRHRTRSVALAVAGAICKPIAGLARTILRNYSGFGGSP